MLSFYERNLVNAVKLAVAERRSAFSEFYSIFNRIKLLVAESKTTAVVGNYPVAVIQFAYFVYFAIRLYVKTVACFFVRLRIHIEAAYRKVVFALDSVFDDFANLFARAIDALLTEVPRDPAALEVLLNVCRKTNDVFHVFLLVNLTTRLQFAIN